MRLTLALPSVISLVLCSAAFQVAGPSPYFGQPVPGLAPARFAPGIISTDAIELNTVFAPGMKELFFARRVDGMPAMFHSLLADGAWGAPRQLLLFPGPARAIAVDMALSPDGNELYFLGNYRNPAAGGVRSTDIWRSRRVNGAWATAEVLPGRTSVRSSRRRASISFYSRRHGAPEPRPTQTAPEAIL
jgi:hypothetical protein